MNALYTGLPLVLGAGLLAAGAAVFFHRVIPVDTSGEFREHSGQLAVVGTLFAITAGFLVVTTWGALGAANENVSKETSALTDAYWSTITMPDAQRVQFQTALRDYVRVAIDDEWPLMARRQKLSREAWDKVNDVRVHLESERANSSDGGAAYGEAISRLRDVADARRTRAVHAKIGIPSILWITLFIAGLLVVAVPVIIGAPRLSVHVLLAFLAAAVVTFILVLVWELNNPFGGSLNADDKPMEEVLVSFDNIDTAARDEMHSQGVRR